MPSVHAYSIESVPFYDTRQQQYIKILCVNSAKVVGALADRIKTVRAPRLTNLNGIYNSNSNSNKNSSSNSNCIHALMSVSGDYMTPDDLPELFAFLATNGYTVDQGLTKLAAKHGTANANALVCIVSYTMN